MTAKPKSKPVDPWPLQATPKPKSAARQLGLSRDLVDQIYEHVLGVVPVTPEGHVDHNGPAQPAKPVDRTPNGRFNRGASGNPKGRPKREEPHRPIPPAALAEEGLSATVRRQVAQTLKAKTDQGEVDLTVVEAAMAKMVREAIKGNTGHSRTLMQLVARAEAEEAKRKLARFSYWSAAKEQAKELYLQAEQAGEEPPLSIDPEDIELHADGTVEIVGPTNPDAIKATRQIQGRVDYHIVNIAYAQWVEKRWIRLRRQRVKGLLYAELAFWDEQDDLPPRLKMSLNEVNERLRSYARFSGRVLHGFLRAKAEPHGLDVPPREARAPLIVPTEVLEFAKEKKIGIRQLLPMWLEAQDNLAQLLGDEMAASTTASPSHLGMTDGG